jgi:hypothetical protein
VNTAFRSLIVTIWLIGALYVAVAGWVAYKTLEGVTVSSGPDQYVEYEGLSFQNKENLQEFLHDKQSYSLFPWIFALPQELVPILTSIAFGTLGGVAALLKQILHDRLPVSNLPVFSRPVFGALMGFMLFLLSFLAPALFVTSSRPSARAETLAGLSFFGGAFSDLAFTWVEAQVRKLFSSKSPEPTA